MKKISNYFDPSLCEKFRHDIPKLRALIGSKKFEPVGSNYGVGGNTFRAYTGWNEPPSKVYRLWAAKVCARLDVCSLEHQLSTREGFDKWHEELAETLQNDWQKQQGRYLSFAHQYKLIDLFIKWLSSHDLSSQKLAEIFLHKANCALDSQTLSKLNKCLSMALPITKPSMGDIHSKNTYMFCQNLIEKFSAHAGGTRLLFDYFAWRKGG